MIICQLTSRTDGRHILVIGLEAENATELMRARPIWRELDDVIPDLAGWSISILTGEDYDRFLAWAQTNGATVSPVPEHPEQPIVVAPDAAGTAVPEGRIGEEEHQTTDDELWCFNHSQPAPRCALTMAAKLGEPPQTCRWGPKHSW